MPLGLRKITPFLFAACLWAGTAYAQDTQEVEGYFQTETAHKARQNWILNCQGCHKIDATGRPEKGLPNLSGEVAKFLSVEGGREYLSRVPGVTNAGVSDEALTDLINWLLLRFDPDNIPPDHIPYSVSEVAKWRKQPLSTDSAEKRQALLLQLENLKNQGESNDL